MTGRERIQAAIRHETPDRVPVDLGATPSSTISAIAYNNLKEYLGRSDLKTLVYDVVQQLAQPDEVFLDRYGVDVVDIGRAFNTHESEWYPVQLSDGREAWYPRWFRPMREGEYWVARDRSGLVLARMPVGSYFFDQAYFPYESGYPVDYANVEEDFQRNMWAAYPPSPWDKSDRPDFWEHLRVRTLALRQKTDRALLIGVGCNLFENGNMMRRMDNFMMDLLMDPSGAERFLDQLMAMHLEKLDRVCRAVGDVVDIVKFGDDLGMDSGPMMSPETYRSLFKPRHKALCDYVYRHSGMVPMLHSCGSIYQLLPDLIEAGFRILNPVQTACRDMDPGRLVREFGKDLVFWGGGADTRTVLNRGTAEEVRRHVLERLEIFAPGGGYVFNTVHNILPEVPPANIEAMFAAVAEFNGAGSGN
jgi:uroporphyrinogen decarboxylase